MIANFFTDETKTCFEVARKYMNKLLPEGMRSIPSLDNRNWKPAKKKKSKD